MSEPIRFYFQGHIQSVDQVAVTQTILQHLREDKHCMGTKEACAEGDCGACTVVIAEIKDGLLEMKSANSCIQFMPTLDGKALFTVEDLKQADGALHPVQQALVECHGSQCGFCTPGFAMSLWSLYLKKNGETTPPCRQEINDTLSGNLCRCTGYRPIIDAAKRMTELPEISFDKAELTRTLQGMQRDDTFIYKNNGQNFYAPRSLAQLIALRDAKPQACLLSGSTDVGLWVTKQMRDLGDIIYIRQVKELHSITERDQTIEIGTGVSLNDAYAAASRHYKSELSEIWQRFASMPIRNIGTLGGNLANGSPIGDSAPWMIALGAEIILNGIQGRRVLLLENFYLDYMKKDLRAGEFIEAVRIPLPRPNLHFRTYKLAKRFDQDISAVCAAFAITLSGDTVCDAHIVYGGMAATSRRAANAEAAINGQPWNEMTLTNAMAMLATDYAPLSDMRASSEYRMKTAQNLLRRFWLETRLDAPMDAASLYAFASR